MIKVFETDLDFLGSPISSTAKLVWLLIRAGFSSPDRVRKTLKMSRTQIHVSLKELVNFEMVVQVDRGYYEVVEEYRCAENRTKCAENRTSENEMCGKPDIMCGKPYIENITESRERCAEIRTKCAENRTKRAENRTKCPENRTLEEDAQVYFKSKVKKSKERDFEKEKKTIGELFGEVDLFGERYVGCRKATEKEFRSRGVSPDLLDRIAVGILTGIPGLDTKTMLEVRDEAREAQRAGEIKHAWMRVAKHVKYCYTKADIEWEPCRTEREIKIAEMSERRRVGAADSGRETKTVDATVEPGSAVVDVTEFKRGIMEDAKQAGGGRHETGGKKVASRNQRDTTKVTSADLKYEKIDLSDPEVYARFVQFADSDCGRR